MAVRKGFIILGITVAMLIVLEVVSRIILSWVYDRQFDSSLIEEHKYSASSGLKANASGTVWGKPFHTDEMGGRRQSKKKKGKLKLLVIGDSVTEGVGVEDSATFTNLVQWGKWDVRNISLIGWSSSDYRNVVEQMVEKDSMIKDICIFYCLNDIYGKAQAKDLPAIAGKGFLSKVNVFLQERYATYKLIKLLMYQSSDHYYRYDEALYKDTNRIKELADDFIHIRDVCNKNEVYLSVFILPYRSQLYDRNNNFPQKVLAEEFAKSNIQSFDLLKELPVKEDYRDWYLFGDEIHLSARGHQAVADIVNER